jgi:hypothetical protein
MIARLMNDDASAHLEKSAGPSDSRCPTRWIHVLINSNIVISCWASMEMEDRFYGLASDRFLTPKTGALW